MKLTNMNSTRKSFRYVCHANWWNNIPVIIWTYHLKIPTSWSTFNNVRPCSDVVDNRPVKPRDHEVCSFWIHLQHQWIIEELINNFLQVTLILFALLERPFLHNIMAVRAYKCGNCFQEKSEQINSTLNPPGVGLMFKCYMKNVPTNYINLFYMMKHQPPLPDYTPLTIFSPQCYCNKGLEMREHILKESLANRPEAKPSPRELMFSCYVIFST